jgi:hypothetical protein
MESSNKQTMKIKIGLLNEALDQMPNSFTSYEFYQVLRSLNYVIESSKDYNFILKFLKKRTKQDSDSTKVWHLIIKEQKDIAPQPSKSEEKPQEPVKEKLSQMTIDDVINEEIGKAVKLLKNNGYKVLKPVSKYVEL